MSHSIFSIQGLPRPFFNDTYLVLATWQPSQTTWRAEYYILTRRPREDGVILERFLPGAVVLDHAMYPAEMPDRPTIDEQSAVEEAKRQASIVLIDELENLVREQQRPELAHLSPQFVPPVMSLGQLWSLGTYRHAIQELYSATGSPRLKLHLSIAMTMVPVSRA